MKQKLEKWLKWLEFIRHDIRELVRTKYAYHEIINMIDGNSNLNRQDNFFYRYLADTYKNYVVIGIRRQIKYGKDSACMVRLLEEIISSPEILTRKNYVAMHNPPAQDWADEDFNQFASPGSAYINRDLVANDLTSLQEASSERLKDFADKRVAHLDQRESKGVPSFSEIDSCIDLLERIYIKYHMLFHAKKLDTLFKEPRDDWKNVFRVPWLPSTEQRSNSS